MSTLQWIGLAVGLLVVLTGLPVVIWPGPTSRRVLTLMGRKGVLRSWGVLLLLIAVAIVRTAAEPFSIFERVMRFVALLMAVGGLIDLLSPESSRGAAAKLFEREALLRFGSGIGVLGGCWIVYLSLTA